MAAPLAVSSIQRLLAAAGGEDGLESLLIEFYSRMSRDVLIGFFFDGRDLRAIALKQKEFLLRAMGARPSYSGKAPAQAHGALPPILDGHFDRRLRLLETLLAERGLNAEDIRTWIQFESTFRTGIVAKKD